MVKISRDYLHLLFRKILFLKKFAFSLSHDNKSKNYPIDLKFGTHVAFIYLQIESDAQNIGPLHKNLLEIKNKKKKNASRLLRKYLVYRLEILTSYCSNWSLYVVKISRDYLHMFLEEKCFWKNLRFGCRTITRAKITLSS